MTHLTMRLAHLAFALPFCAVLPAQTKSVVFTGRFDCVSLDQVNERAGGSLSLIREFDLAVATPGAAAIARSWIPTTAHSAAWGDGHGDGNYVRFFNWKAVFDRFNFAGPFVKNSDRAKNDPTRFFWTIRDNAVNKVFKVLTSNGTTPVQIKPGDFFRWGKNGNVEFFITQAQIQKAAEAWQGQVQTGVHQATKLVETLSTAGQSMAHETVKAVQAQARVAQTQVAEFATAGRELAESVADTAKAARKNSAQPRSAHGQPP